MCWLYHVCQSKDKLLMVRIVLRPLSWCVKKRRRLPFLQPFGLWFQPFDLWFIRLTFFQPFDLWFIKLPFFSSLTSGSSDWPFFNHLTCGSSDLLFFQPFDLCFISDINLPDLFFTLAKGRSQQWVCVTLHASRYMRNAVGNNNKQIRNQWNF